MRSVYFFAPGEADEPPAPDCPLGEEGRGLLAMGRLGLPVLPGFLLFLEDGPGGRGPESSSVTLLRQAAHCLRRLWEMQAAAGSGGPLRLELRAADRSRRLRLYGAKGAARGSAGAGALSNQTVLRDAGFVLAAARGLFSRRMGDSERGRRPVEPSTAVVVQLGWPDDPKCPRRTCYSRDPGTGAPGPRLAGESPGPGVRRPGPAAQLADACRALESELQEVQEVQFAVAGGQLRLVGARSAVCSPAAALRLAVDWAVEGRISREEALGRVNPEQIDVLLRPRRLRLRGTGAAASAGAEAPVRGRGVCPGVGVGELVLTLGQAETAIRGGRRVILACEEQPAPGADWLARCQGIVVGGGETCGLAAAARRWGIPAVAARLGTEGREVRLGPRRLRPGQWLAVDGSSGEILFGPVRLAPARLSRRARLLLSWADEVRRRPPTGSAGGRGGRSPGALGVRANADLPDEALLARRLGAEGLGLVRTERMFLRPEPLRLFRTVILMDDAQGRRLCDRALRRLQALQRRDFRAVLRVMAGLPVTVRLLDPPLHEFLPEDKEEVQALAEELGIPVADAHGRIASVRQRNPMLGLRGCRLGLLRPRIYEMQTRALAEAAGGLRRQGVDAQAQIMIPLVSSHPELREAVRTVRRALAEISERIGGGLGIAVGTMIETPRAALCADRLAEVAQFFSFGTNDLTQLCFGYSRDDAGQFLPAYLEKGILPADPFRALDEEGVGELVRIALDRGRRARPELPSGLCGEQAAEARSVAFCSALGIDYVSCSAYRIPAARLAAARAVLGLPPVFALSFPVKHLY